MRLATLVKEHPAVALVFVASGCPVSQQYWERIKGVWYNHRDSKLLLLLVGGNSDDSLARLQKVAEEAGLDVPVYWDDGHAVARSFGMDFTPCAVVLGAKGTPLYRGRLDDSWRDPSKVSHPFLEDAVKAALQDIPSEDQRDGPFVGCRMR